VRPELFEKRFREVLAVKNRLLALFGHEPLDFASTFATYAGYADRIRPFVRDIEPLVQEAVYGGRRVLFEGAQGTFLDLDSGTYPYVTSSHPVAGGACLGTGIGPRAIDHVLGVAKAYTTRVGSGPFPTELHDAVGERIRAQGQEYGTVTGRGRRCGWLDLPALRHSVMLNSLSGLILTRLDVLQGIPEIKVAVRYKLDGVPLAGVPNNPWDFARVQPEFVTLPGWDADLRSARTWEDLPAEVRGYVEFVEQEIGVSAAILSIGPDREETIVRRPDLIWAASARAASIMRMLCAMGTAWSASPWVFQMGKWAMRPARFGFPPPQIGAMAAKRLGWRVAQSQVP
jgi:adenylosuccinate synthase